LPPPLLPLPHRHPSLLLHPLMSPCCCCYGSQGGSEIQIQGRASPPPPSPRTMHALLRSYNQDRDGQVRYDNFRRYMDDSLLSMRFWISVSRSRSRFARLGESGCGICSDCSDFTAGACNPYGSAWDS
jgi:hypothetical protein